PTAMVMGATRDTTTRLHLGEIDYDHFLAECSQAVSVDISAASEAYARLIRDAQLRLRMGEAGRKQALDRFDWPHVIKAYEDLWQSQEAQRQVHASTRTSSGRPAECANY